MNWNLNYFYSDEADFHKDVETIKSGINDLKKYEGKLNKISSLEQFYKDEENLLILVYRVYAYAHLKSDLNLNDTASRNLMAIVGTIFATFSQTISFVNPEIISIGQEKINDMITNSKIINEYKFSLESLFRTQEHILSASEENLLSNFIKPTSLGSQLYQNVSLLDRQNETIKLANGEKIEITLSNYCSLIENANNPKDRKKIFEATFKRFKENANTFAGIYDLVAQSKYAFAKSRGYNNALEAALDKNNIPLSVYENLISVAGSSTSIIKKYNKLKKEVLGLSKYHTYDRFLNIGKSSKKYSYDESKAIFFESIKGLDQEFVQAQYEALEDGFVDVLPDKYKRTGAYSSSLYSYHPYILLNHDDTLDSMFTLAHEAGHSAHSILACKTQPQATADYVIFTAEVASTFNEHLLLDYLVQNATSKEDKIALLEKSIDNVLGTFYRQTLFATYEYEAHKLVTDGQQLNKDNLSKIMINLYKKYYGIDITKENGKEYVWAYIPHLFGTPFYVYQYATSFSASIKFFDQVKNGGEKEMKNFISLLKAGGRDYPIALLKNAGVDLTTKEPFQAVVDYITKQVNLLETLLKDN